MPRSYRDLHLDVFTDHLFDGDQAARPGRLVCRLEAQTVIAAANAATIVNLQGVRMGRPSVIHMAIASDAGTISRVQVEGDAVLAGEGTLYV